jgi:hypothetical protein
VAAGGQFGIALLANATAMSWSENGSGQLGQLRASSSAVSPRAIRVGGQVADWRLAENTTLGISFMGAAIG